jgi:hypothetical protein
MGVWEEIARFHYPLVFAHQHSGQAESCLEGLIDYAARIAVNKHTYAFRTPYQIIGWLWRQPVKLDTGDGPAIQGCEPKQRSRIWPDDGLNCWEATAHLLGVAFAQQWLIEFHIYDAPVGRQRHVFPAVRPIGSNALPEPLIIQPPIKTGRSDITMKSAIAQAWYNDALGAVHIVGDKVLRVFGQGELADNLATTWGDSLPDWARTAKQKEQRAAEVIKQAAVESTKLEGSAADRDSNAPKGKEGNTALAEPDDLRARVAKLEAENRFIKQRLKDEKERS